MCSKNYKRYMMQVKNCNKCCQHKEYIEEYLKNLRCNQMSNYYSKYLFQQKTSMKHSSHLSKLVSKCYHQESESRHKKYILFYLYNLDNNSWQNYKGHKQELQVLHHKNILSYNFGIDCLLGSRQSARHSSVQFKTVYKRRTKSGNRKMREEI